MSQVAVPYVGGILLSPDALATTSRDPYEDYSDDQQQSTPGGAYERRRGELSNDGYSGRNDSL